MNIYQKLDKARELVRNTKRKKDGRNTFSKYDYFTPETVELIVADVCNQLKLLPICNLKRNEFGLYQEMELYDIEEFGDADEPMQSIIFELATVHGSLKATNETQQMGGTDTYSERYIKMKVFQIKDNNLDFDAQSDKEKSVTPAATKEDLSFLN